MGYCTYYTLDVDGGETSAADIAKIVELNKYFDDELREDIILPLLDGDADEMKWYKHDEDMKALSALFPHVVFILEGEGEDRDDNWRHFYQNGEIIRKQYAELVWGEY